MGPSVYEVRKWGWWKKSFLLGPNMGKEKLIARMEGKGLALTH